MKLDQIIKSTAVGSALAVSGGLSAVAQEPDYDVRRNIADGYINSGPLYREAIVGDIPDRMSYYRFEQMIDNNPEWGGVDYTSEDAARIKDDLDLVIGMAETQDRTSCGPYDFDLRLTAGNETIESKYAVARDFVFTPDIRGDDAHRINEMFATYNNQSECLSNDALIEAAAGIADGKSDAAYALFGFGLGLLFNSIGDGAEIIGDSADIGGGGVDRDIGGVIRN